MAGRCIHGNEGLDFTGGEFIDQLNDCQFLFKGCVEWSRFGLMFSCQSSEIFLY
jgi:hypothetical protein